MEKPPTVVTQSNDSPPTKEELIATKVELEMPTGPQCYCGKPRDFAVPDFQCSVCYKWFHIVCIDFNIGKSLPFMTTYHFMCKDCNSGSEEVFSRKQANFAVMCQTALANLTFKHDGRVFFSKDNDIIPFLEEHWEELTTQPRKTSNTWYPNIHKTLMSGDLFTKYEIGDDLYVSLANTDLRRMGPSYDRFRALTSQLKTINKMSIISSGNGDESAGGAGSASDTGERKRKAQPQQQQQLATGQQPAASAHGYNLAVSEDVTGSGQGSSLVRSTRRNTAVGAANLMPGLGSADEGKAKLNALGIPVDYPFNKEGYRYVLVEPDKHANGRQLWDESEHTAGKPIPGLFYRVLNPSRIVMSQNDRATHLKLSEDQLTLTGDKGYGAARCTHSVHTGTWYFECTIQEMPEMAACRIGWSQLLGNLQAPVGYDKFSYSWRSHLGTKFHESCGKHFAERGYQKGDVIGCLIHLPQRPRTCTWPVDDPSRRRELMQPTQPSPSELTGPSNAKRQKLTGNSASAVSMKMAARGSSAHSNIYYWNHLPDTYKDRHLIKFRNCFYFESKDEPQKAEKVLVPLVGSKMVFYRNGEQVGTAFENINMGGYYPAISIYRSAVVQVNFGPNLKHLPREDWPEVKPMSARLLPSDVEQCMADMLYLVENRNLVEDLVKQCAPGF